MQKFLSPLDISESEFMRVKGLEVENWAE